ncbi:c-type cytochrome [Larkinella rosea]|uniref:Cytochrome c n=1 Tax=Larkinella rosea TaxID=2025312 RepID=A0A3P1BM66_9BACT|nr:cytochrome c [Larkinella rosea]RRB02115.1 cytochrome c [Larkinella rosea]
MKKALRILLFVVGFVVVALLGFISFAAIRGVPSYDAPVIQDISVNASPARLARGAKIAQMHCIACHADENKQLTGRQLSDLPSLFGTIYSMNITQDKTVGIGNWTDGELYYFLRTGLRKDGSFAPIMPKFATMADEDLQSVIVWLRSGEAPVQAVAKEAPKSDFSLFSKLLANTVIKPLPFPEKAILIPDSTNELAFGRYVADGLGTCYVCHSADFTKQNPLHPELSEGYYGGGNEMKTADGKPIFTANLTFDEETGIAKKYTKQQFIQAVKACVRPDGGLIRGPMFPHQLTDYEAGAIFEYLKTVPKIKNDIAHKEKEALAAK